MRDDATPEDHLCECEEQERISELAQALNEIHLIFEHQAADRFGTVTLDKTTVESIQEWLDLR